MDQQIVQQVGMGTLVLVVGVLGWVLPFRWNFLRLKPSFARLVPEKVNQIIPKVVGTILAILGAAVLIGTVVVGRFK